VDLTGRHVAGILLNFLMKTAKFLELLTVCQSLIGSVLYETPVVIQNRVSKR